MNSSERDRLCPPIWIAAVTEERVYEPVSELPGTYEIVAKLHDRLRPLVGPG